MELRANPTKIGARLAEKMSQRVILVVLVLFVGILLVRLSHRFFFAAQQALTNSNSSPYAMSSKPRKETHRSNRMGGQSGHATIHREDKI